MSLQQRLTNLERIAKPSKMKLEPLLLKWMIPIGETPKPDDDGGILYIYDGVPASEYRLTYKELLDYEASDEPAEVWVKSQPQLKVKV